MTDRVICMGEAMVELSLDNKNDGHAAVGFAGDTLNTAIYLKRSAPYLDVDYVTKLGTDPFSEQMIDLMRTEALGTELIVRDPDRQPGLYAISTDSAGERSFTYWRSASAAREMLTDPPVNLDAMEDATLVYASAITIAILPIADRIKFLQWVKRYRARGGCFAFDSNYRPQLWQDARTAQQVIEAFWRQTDIGFPSLDDEAAIFGETDEKTVMNRLNTWGVRKGALKRGAKGPISLDGTQLPACKAADKVVDSTAAGDSFNAGFLASYLSGASSPKNCLAGHSLASQVIGHRGAILPRSTEGKE